MPVEVLSQLREFGRASWEARLKGRPLNDHRYQWDNFYAGAIHACQVDLAKAIAEVHGSANGDPLAAFGGYLIIAEFDGAVDNAMYLEMMDTALQMMHESHLSSGHLTGYESQRWITTHGDLRTSFDHIVDVAVPEHTVTGVDLPIGGSLMVAKLGPDDLDNQFWLERIDHATYGAFSMRPWNSDATILTRCDEPSIRPGSTAEDVLRGIGAELRLRPYWAHDQLEPFFTDRKNTDLGASDI